jgi:hypothetical protein
MLWGLMGRGVRRGQICIVFALMHFGSRKAL